MFIVSGNVLNLTKLIKLVGKCNIIISLCGLVWHYLTKNVVSKVLFLLGTVKGELLGQNKVDLL